MKQRNIERIKSEINLCIYASTFGFKLVKNRSSRSSAYLSNENEKIIVKVDSDNHWVYFNVHDQSDSGSIIDFHSNRTGEGVGQTIRTLDCWSNDNNTNLEIISSYKLKPVSRDLEAVVNALSVMDNAINNEYLKSRNINNVIMSDKRFLGAIKEGKKGEIIFPHIDQGGYCGFESRNHNYKAFSKGGVKTFWTSRTKCSDKRLVMCESGIDCLSYHVLKGATDNRYLSLGGEVSDDTLKLISLYELALPSDIEIIGALDNDKSGENLFEKLNDRLKKNVIRDRPVSNDWSLDLKIAIDRRSP